MSLQPALPRTSNFSTAAIVGTRLPRITIRNGIESSFGPAATA
jgi:hypothetical protein